MILVMIPQLGDKDCVLCRENVIEEGLRMGHGAKKSEHSGAKKGKGAYWGRRVAAKKESNRLRRETGKNIIRKETL